MVEPARTVAFSQAVRCISAEHGDDNATRLIMPTEPRFVADVTPGKTQIPRGVGWFCPACTVRLVAYWVRQNQEDGDAGPTKID
jgi:hypothetical protein